MYIKAFVECLNNAFHMDEQHTVKPVYNENTEIIGWSVVEKGVESDYPVYTADELIKKYFKP